MRIFNFHIMSVGKFREEKRDAEKHGHMIALSTFHDSDKIYLGDNHIIGDRVIRKKLVLMGDKHFIMNNHIECKGEAGIEIV